jgi:hypothetical protein
MWCKQCGYPLDGLSEARCPECGREFDPDDEGSFVSKSLILRNGCVYPMVLGVIAFVSIGLPDPLPYVGFPIFACSAVVAGVTAERRARRLQGPLPSSYVSQKIIVWRVVTILALLAASSLVVIAIPFAKSHLDMSILRRKVAASDRVLVHYGLRVAVTSEREEIERFASSIQRKPDWRSPVQKRYVFAVNVRCFSNGEAWYVIGGGDLESRSLSGDRRIAESTFAECERIVSSRRANLLTRYPDTKMLDRLLREFDHSRPKTELNGAALWFPRLNGRQELPVAAIYVRDPRGWNRPGFAVLLAVWANGDIIWSEDTIGGGPPFREAQINGENVSSILERILASKETDDFADLELREEFNPHTILAITGDDVDGLLRWRPYDEFEESNHTDSESVDPSVREWMEILKELTSLIPAEGTPRPNLKFDWPGVFF